MSAGLPAALAGDLTGSGRSHAFLPGVRGALLVSESSGNTGSGVSRQLSAEVSPYFTASVVNARTQGSITYVMRHFQTSIEDESRSYTRHDLRANLNTRLIGDWLGMQASAAIYNTNATVAGGLSIDPAASATNNAVLRTVSVSPYVQGRAGALASWRMQYRYDQSDTSDNIQAALARQTHTASASLEAGPQFNPWGWALRGTGIRREFQNQISLTSASAIATLYYAPSTEFRLGGSINRLYIERLSNAQGRTSGWGPGLSLDWTPSRRTTVRASINRQYYGTTEFLSMAHRTSHLMFGLDYGRSVLQSSTAALLTLNPGTLLSGGGYLPALNPLFTQFTEQGLLPPNEVVIGTSVINDALVRNQTLTATAGYRMPQWSLTGTVFGSRRATVLSASLFGIPNALSATSFGEFKDRGMSMAATVSIDPHRSLGLSLTSRDIGTNANDATTRFTVGQALLTFRMDPRSSMTLGARRSVQTGDGVGPIHRRESAVFATVDFRLR